MVNADYHIELKVLFSSFDTQKFNFELKIGHTPARAVSVRGNNFRIIVFLKKLYPSLC